jgi:hypothetical protein
MTVEPLEAWTCSLGIDIMVSIQEIDLQRTRVTVDDYTKMTNSSRMWIAS